ncbi:MAG: pyruvate kinase [Cytophagales bacterium]|nr:MAG: pyruvate kinase [Cytophagales bacterium]TAF60592.1 MAG: pyruvate kinase [Cytophagales bacterium]
MKPFFNKTKIIATVGTVTNTREKLLELILAGVDVFRLNFSHGTHADHLKVIEHVRSINQEYGYNVGLLQDLQGPKIRVGMVENNGMELVKGGKLTITINDEIGKNGRVSCVYKALPKDVKVGDLILMDDGKLEVCVTAVRDTEVDTEVNYGGILKSKKGMNLPLTEISAPSLTAKDREDLTFGLEHDVEWIALSFVRSAEDILEVRQIIKESGKFAHVIAKIERPEAIGKNIDRIIEVTDAVMVARGDLGVEIPLEDVPVVQKMIVHKCNAASKPVVIATQMMESMIDAPRPTRAETNDVANAVLDGADALMLSGETAVGKYPLEVIRSMSKTINSVEISSNVYNKYRDIDTSVPDATSRSLVQMACRLAEETQATAIIGMTQSGYTAYHLASHRPEAHVFIFTSNVPLLNTMSLIWGVRGFYYDKMTTTDETIADTANMLIEQGHLKKGDIFINTASMPIQEKHQTNMLKITKVK